MSLDQTRIAAVKTPEGPRIMLGLLSEDETRFTEQRDATSDCFQAIVGLVLPVKSLPIEVNGKPKYRITVEEIKPDETPANLIVPAHR
jgi:hypothetical protein